VGTRPGRGVGPAPSAEAAAGWPVRCGPGVVATGAYSQAPPPSPRRNLASPGRHAEEEARAPEAGQGAPRNAGECKRRKDRRRIDLRVHGRGSADSETRPPRLAVLSGAAAVISGALSLGRF
jgi:hypothetical protein